MLPSFSTLSSVLAMCLFSLAAYLYTSLESVAGSPERYVVVPAIGFLSFVLLADRANEVFRGADTLARIFGILGLGVMVYVINYAAN